MAVFLFTKKWPPNDRREALSFDNHFIRDAKVIIFFQTEIGNFGKTYCFTIFSSNTLPSSSATFIMYIPVARPLMSMHPKHDCIAIL